MTLNHALDRVIAEMKLFSKKIKKKQFLQQRISFGVILAELYGSLHRFNALLSSVKPVGVKYERDYGQMEQAVAGWQEPDIVSLIYKDRCQRERQSIDEVKTGLPE